MRDRDVAKNIQITIVAGDMYRLAAIKDGRVQLRVRRHFIPMVRKKYSPVFRYAEFDCCELSFSSHMRVTSQGKADYVGIPAFVSRVFRHSGFYVRTDRGIEKPEDLRGKLVGTPEYQMTAPVWMRGILEDQYGIKSNEIRWRSGGQEEAGRDERTPFEAPEGLDLEPIPEDRTLVEMFEAGELDALTTAREPSSFTLRKPNIGRLFPDFRTAEKQYYEETGIYPIMHLMGLRKDLPRSTLGCPATCRRGPRYRVPGYRKDGRA